MSDIDLTSESEEDSAYGKRVGERLRAIRRQKRMSLQDVEAESSHEFKASVLGAYERGERAISVPRLHRLARFYNVPVSQLLPRSDDDNDIEGVDSREDANVTIDLTRLESMQGPDAAMLTRYLSMIQMQRQDFNGRMLTIRRDDLRAIACILDTSVDSASTRLSDLGLRLGG
ncbi:MAG: transcriptional regulator [Acidimicrobiales bacterium]|nr:transcriptional regulator [Planctomycetaceae bacterium]MCB0990616.1 transcriptional regulator [Acidimicrobiales bacterium]